MSELVVLQHHPATGVSAYGDVLDGRSNELRWRAIDVGQGEALPAVDEVAGILTMGGPQSVVERADHPWMDAEAALLREAVAADVPVMAVCLGAQLLAEALGGEAGLRAVPEFGFIPLQRTEAGRADQVAGGWADGTAMLFSHEDEILRLPEGAEPLLEGNDGVPAWRVGSAHAVQFHPEVTAAQVEAWGTVLGDLVARAGADLEVVLEAARRRERFHRALGAAWLGRWLDEAVLPRVRATD